MWKPRPYSLKLYLSASHVKKDYLNLYALVGTIKNYDFSYFFIFSITMLVTILEVASSFVLLVFSFTFIETLSNKTVLNVFDIALLSVENFSPFTTSTKKMFIGGRAHLRHKPVFFFDGLRTKYFCICVAH